MLQHDASDWDGGQDPEVIPICMVLMGGMRRRQVAAVSARARPEARESKLEAYTLSYVMPMFVYSYMALELPWRHTSLHTSSESYASTRI